MSDVFSYTAEVTNNQRVDNRSLATQDIQGAYSRKTTLSNMNQENVAAGMRNGSPSRKNESSVFAHLTEQFGKETLKRKEITKPAVVNNNLSGNPGGRNVLQPSNNYPTQGYSQQNDYYAQNLQELDILEREKEELAKQF